MRKYVFALVFVIFVIMVLFIELGDIGISGITLNEETLADLKEKHPNDNILVIRMEQTTGPSWQITEN